MESQLLRLGEVLGLLGIGKSTLYTWVAAGTFPAPLKLSPRAARWRQSDVEAWVADLPRRQGGSGD